MRKSDLFDLLAAIKSLAPEEIPIIVGSQAVHLVTNFPPEIVRQSIECDFLIIGGKSEIRAEINKKLGIFSSFQVENGFYADALGLATVVLPVGWEDRLHELKDENAIVVAKVADIYDIAVSKLIAGREKDFIFIRELILNGYIVFDMFLKRAKLIKDMPQNEILISRLDNLAKILERKESLNIKDFINKLKSA